MMGVIDAFNELHRQLDGVIDERLRLHATSSDTCPDDILTAMISRKPPVSHCFLLGICSVVVLGHAGQMMLSFFIQYLCRRH
jgi:hypothetical protein